MRRSELRAARLHARAANIRRDALHKLATRLAATRGTVVVEHLNVAGMLRNRKLARALHDAGFGEIRRRLSERTENPCRTQPPGRAVGPPRSPHRRPARQTGTASERSEAA